jgi:hypothetical protein
MNPNKTKFPSLNLTKKTSFVFIIIFATLVLLDSNLVKLFSFSGTEPSPTVNIAIFVIFSAIFGMTSIMLLTSVKKITWKYESRLPLTFRYHYAIILATLILTLALIFLIILQLVLLQQYSIDLLRVQTYLSHLSPIWFLSFLIFSFLKWLTFKKNLVIILYSISLVFVCANLLISLVYLDSYFSASHSVIVRPLTIVSYVISLGGSSFTQSLSIAFDVLSVVSFLFMWLATAVLLSQFKFKMGRLKFYLLMSIPLLYYLFPFQGYFGDIFFPLLVFSPVGFTVIYILVFSGTKQVGAVFFGLTFWSASSLVFDERIRRSLLISSIGMVIVFTSIELAPLQYRVYPPYGLVTEAYIPLGAFLLFVGIFASAIQISRNTELRKEFYKSASGQLALFKNIGLSQMEKELEERVKAMQKSSEAWETPYESEELEAENAKRILTDVLNELYSEKRTKQKPND